MSRSLLALAVLALACGKSGTNGNPPITRRL